MISSPGHPLSEIICSTAYVVQMNSTKALLTSQTHSAHGTNESLLVSWDESSHEERIPQPWEVRVVGLLQLMGLLIPFSGTTMAHVSTPKESLSS